MKILLFGGAAAFVVGAMYLHGDFEGGEIYNKPPEEVVRELSGLRPSESILSINSSTSAANIWIDPKADGAVGWQFVRDGETIARLVARVTPAGEGRSRVVVDYQPGEAEENSARTRDVRGFAKAVVRPSMIEQIDAKLEGRPVNPAVARDAVTAWLMVNLPALQREALGRMQDFNDSAARARAKEDFKRNPDVQRAMSAAKEQENAWRASKGLPTADATPMTSARPMIDTRPMSDR